jgi:hypothetical protein
VLPRPVKQPHAGTPHESSVLDATVTPDSGLVGGDVVTVEGSGATPSGTVFFCQAIDDGTPDQSDCGASTVQSTPADAAGEFAAMYTVRRFITPAGRPSVDCAASGATCVIGASDGIPQPGSSVATVPISFAAPPPASFTISGTVTDPNGDPVSGSAVWAYAPADGFVGSVQTTTDAQGSYTLAVQPDIPYRVLFHAPSGSTLTYVWWNGQPSRQLAHPITLPNSNLVTNQEVAEANGQLAGTGAIAGTVTDTNGNPLPGTAVWAFGPGDTWLPSHWAVSTSNGTYVIAFHIPGFTNQQVLFVPPAGSGLAAEWYNNVAQRRSATPVLVITDETTTGIDAVLEPNST